MSNQSYAHEDFEEGSQTSTEGGMEVVFEIRTYTYIFL